MVAIELPWYKIVATSAEPIASIQATMDNLENLTIIYTTSSGTQTRLDVDANLAQR